MLPETVGKLIHEHSNIIGIKDATGDLNRLSQLREQAGSGLAIYSGDDSVGLEWMAHGAQGVISITANIVPGKMHAMCSAALDNAHQQAIALDTQLQDLHHAMCIESNPIPAKWALAKLDKIPNGIRLPLTPLSPQHHQTLMNAMETAGVNITEAATAPT